MAKLLHLAVVLLLLTVAIIQAQRCRHLMVVIRSRQRYCIRNCPPRPATCIRPFKDLQVLTCPPGCCREACLIQIRLTKPGQRICELRCRQSGEIPPLNCYTATRVYRAVVCPRHCCRLEGNRCRRL